jgi:phosphatidyl-myo-inositol dimannoside synthase
MHSPIASNGYDPRVAERRPRLLVLTPDFPPVLGGIQTLTHRLAAEISGFDTRVLTFDAQGAAGFDAAGQLHTRRLRVDNRLGAARLLALNVAAAIEARAFSPEVVLSAHIVVSPAAALIQRTRGARTVQYFHANEIGGKPRLAAFAARHADVVVAVSSYTAGLLASTGAQAAQLELIPPGVDIPREAPAQRAQRPTLLTIARLKDSYKGHDVLIRALVGVRERVPEVELVVIGDGPLRGELELLARTLGVADAVSFLGAVSDERREYWLRRAHVFAMPSRLPADGLAGEGFGIVYLEAAAHGVPVVAGNVAGALDAVADGESGLLVDPTDSQAVAGALSSLLLDGELATRLGRAGAERAKRFAWPLVASRLEAVLLGLVAHQRGGTGAPPP